jgi:hypothetical protein
MGQATVITALAIIVLLIMVDPTDTTVADHAITGTIDAGNRTIDYKKARRDAPGLFALLSLLRATHSKVVEPGVCSGPCSVEREPTPRAFNHGMTRADKFSFGAERISAIAAGVFGTPSA